MTELNTVSGIARIPGEKLVGADKTARIPVKIIPSSTKRKKPAWIRVRASNSANTQRVRALLRENNLHSVCEEASCPNLGECFHHGTASFMIMGDICTRRCPFCDVAHGRPLPLDTDEPESLAKTIALLGLKYIVITSVDRDDLKDGGAAHFADCVRAIRAKTPEVKIEILTPDFRGKQAQALEILVQHPADVFNHNLETIPRLYRQARPGANYAGSLQLLADFKAQSSALGLSVPTKSGLMVGLGETDEELLDVLRDLRAHGVDMLTIGQYLQPSIYHHKVERFVTPETFEMYRIEAEKMGFSQVASAPMVRSSYHADLSFAGLAPTKHNDKNAIIK